MPETTYLHIQGSETDATRVLELPGEAVRVGRGAFCEVRLSEPSLADVQCLLRRRGETWHVQPVGPTELVSIGGMPVDHARPLPMGMPIQVGAYRLVLRPNDWGSFEAPYDLPASDTAAVGAEQAPTEPPAPPEPEEDGGPRRRQARLEQREKWLQGRQEERKWEARWRAAGEGLRTRSVPSTSLRSDIAARAEVGRLPTSSLPGPARVAKTSARPSVPSVPKMRTVIEPHEPQDLIALGQPPTPGPMPDPEILPFGPILVAFPAVEPAAMPRLPRLVEPETPPVALAQSPRAVLSGSEPEGDGVPAVLARPTVIVESPSIAERSPVEASVPADRGAEPTPFFTDARPASTVFWHESTYRTAEESPPRSHDARHPDPVPVPSNRAVPRQDEYPSAATIFAAQGTRAVPEPVRVSRAASRAGRRPMPTDPRPPAEWSIPFRFAALPATMVSAGLIGLGLMLGVSWTKDNLDAGIAARAALRDEKGPPVPIDPTAHPDARWWKTTAGHVAHWAAAIERSPESSDRAGEVRDILDAARRSSPLQSEVRLALGRALPGQDAPHPSRSVGLSRDVVSLTLTGRSLKRAGKVEPALRAYRKALELAAGSDPSRLPSPTFDDDPRVRRYRLPGEAIASAVVRDLDEAGGWDFSEWSRALPPIAGVRLAAGRFLREKESLDAERAFDLALAGDLAVPADPARAAEHHAAQAEALAFKERKSEAAERYRLAIGLATDDLTRRRWQLALAEILTTLGASKERADLLEAAKGADPTEEVTRKALESQKFSGLK